MVFTLHLCAPRLRMNTQPCCTFRLPLGAQVIRHSIGESKRNEINRAFLLPMRQSVRSEADIRIWIEEAQFGHEKPSVKTMATLENAKRLRSAPQGGAVFESPLLTRRTRDRRSLSSKDALERVGSLFSVRQCNSRVASSCSG